MERGHWVRVKFPAQWNLDLSQCTPPPPHHSCLYKAHRKLAAPGLKKYHITQSHHFHWNKIPMQVSLRYKTENEISTNLLNKLVTDNFFFTPKNVREKNQYKNQKFFDALLLFTCHLYLLSLLQEVYKTLFH